MIDFTETDLKAHFETHGKRLVKNTPPNECYKIMIKHISKRNYLQILYSMGYRYLLILMDFFEQREDYAKCSLILSTIHNHNKVSGSNIRTRA